MTRLKAELAKRGIIYEADYYNIVMRGPEYDCSAKLVDVTSDFIITIFYSAVLDPMLNIYDRRTFELIAQQDVRPDYMFFGDKSKNPWGVAVMVYGDGELTGYYKQPK